MTCGKLRSGLTAAALSGVALLHALPAAAQYYYPAPRVYAPAPPPPPSAYPASIGLRQADAIVRSLGLTPVGHAFAGGAVFLVRAVGREGAEVQVAIDRYSGRVVRIERTGYSASRLAALPPGYEAPEGDPSYDEDELPPPRGGLRGDYDERSDGPAPSGPSVVIRRGIQSDELPPPAPPPYGTPRDRDVTGSIERDPSMDRMPRRVAPRAVDPLVGVPKEFRGQQPQPQQEQRMAARPPAAAPRATPMPRPRPADAPQVAEKQENAPVLPTKQEPHTAQQKPRTATPVNPESVPDVQGFE